jgi:RNA polymerase sigma-70 factor (ECF subfamily)
LRPSEKQIFERNHRVRRTYLSKRRRCPRGWWRLSPSRPARSINRGDAGVEVKPDAAANLAMERYASGDDGGFSELYDAIAPRLHGYLLRRSRDRADDLLQQTLLQIHRARGQFIRGADVLPWAFAIARRLMIDDLRRQRREVRVLDACAAGPAEPPSPSAGADQVLEAEQTLRTLEQVLCRLPPSQREAFELVKLEGLSLREAAEILGTTESAIKSSVHRASEALRGSLASDQARASS